MSDPIRCPKCGQQYALKSDMAGKRVQCKKCGDLFQVPIPAVAAQPATPVAQPGMVRPQAAVPVQPQKAAIPVQAIPVQAVPVQAVPVQAIPVQAQGVPMAATPVAMAPVPINPALGPSPTMVAPRRRYRESGFLKAVSHPLVILGIIVAVVGGIAAVGVYFSGDILAAFKPKPLPGDEAMREWIDMLNSAADILADVKDQRSAMNALPRLQSLQNRERELAPKLMEFNQATPEQREHLRKKYEVRMKAALSRLFAELDRIAALQGGPGGRFRSRFAPPKEFAWDGAWSGFFGEEPQGPAAPAATATAPKRTAKVEIVGVAPGQKEFVEDRLKEASGDANVYLDSGGGDVISANITPIADLQALAVKIDLGTPKLDANAHAISIQADPAKFPQPMSPDAKNATSPGYYKANLTELLCPDRKRRREAAARLATAEPKQLRDEIAKALVPIMSENDAASRKAGLEAWLVWRTPATQPDGVQVLLTNARGQDREMQRAAFQALKDLQDPDTAEPLAKMLSGSDFGAREGAQECLVALGPAAEKAVLPLLSSKDHFGRTAAKEILDRVVTKESVPALIELLNQKKGSFGEAQEVAALLAKLKDERALPAIAELLTDSSARFWVDDLLVKMGPSAETVVATYVKHQDPQTAGAAMGVLAKIGGAESVPVVLEALAADNHGVRREGFEFLKRVKDKRALKPLAQMLAEPMFRHDAAETLKKYGPAAEDTMLQGLAHRDRQVNLACLEVLKEVGTEKSLKELKRLLNATKRDAFGRQAVVEAMDAILSRGSGGPFTDPAAEEKEE